MKKQLSLVIGLTILSTGAFASKARLQALGENENGSYFIQDPRNIFYNPARALYHKDGLTFEWGNTANTNDSASTPRAEGGVLKAVGNMVYGLYFGNQADDGNGYKGLSGTAINEGNTVSLLAAGDAGIQWGAALTYGSYTQDERLGDADANPLTPDTVLSTDGDASLLRTRFGVLMGNMEFFARINVMNEAESTITADGVASGLAASAGKKEFKGKSGWQLGGVYTMGEMTYVATVSEISGELNNTIDHKYMAIDLQAGRTMQLNDKATMNYRIGLKRQTEEGVYLVTGSDQGFDSTDLLLSTLGGNAEEVEIMRIPVAVGVEIQAKEWLVLRGSINHNLWSSVDRDGKKSNVQDSTQVTAGAGFVFGDLIVDGMVGNSTGTTRNDDTSGSNGSLRTDELLSRVSMTYRF